MKSQKYKDHLGNEYKSRREMAETYGLTESVVRRRLKRGWDIEKTLTTPPIYSSKPTVKDHKGNLFHSKEEMCLFYNISLRTFKDRTKKGLSLEEVLENPIRIGKCTDHLGNEFVNMETMCKFYNLNLTTYLYRIKNGYDQKSALTTPAKLIKKSKYVDSLGNCFSNKIELASYYNIDKHKLYNMPEENFDDFIKTLVLEKENRKIPKFFDHLGNAYLTETDLAEAYGLSIQALSYRKKNWPDKSLEEILETPPIEFTDWSDCQDHLGNKYNSLTDMCAHYNLRLPYFFRRLHNGWSLEDILTVPLSSQYSHGEMKIADILNAKKIVFIHDKSIFSSTSIKDFEMLRADFFIEKIGIIEFDGDQHFFPSNFFHHNSSLEAVASRDDKKTKLCEAHKIPLLRIRFDQYDKIQELIDDFLENPKKYVKKHNKLLSNKKYWSIRKA